MHFACILAPAHLRSRGQQKIITLFSKNHVTMQIHVHVHFHFDIHMSTDNQQTADNAVINGMLIEELAKKTEELRAVKSNSTISNYLTAQRSLMAYLQTDIPLSQLSSLTMEGYEHWLRGHNVCLNTISCYMRSLRSLLRLVDTSMADKCFANVFTSNTRTRKRSIPVEAIVRLQRLSLPDNTFLSLARDIFLFSFYAMGMPFVDVAHLKTNQIVGDNIIYQRQKTGQQVTIAIEPAMQQLILRYHSGSSPYIFPLLHTGQDKEYLVVLGRYNRALHRLQLRAGIKDMLTSYVVRHSWASTAYHSGVELSVISKALGHTNPQTTITYIREIDDQRLAQANRKIIDAVTET